jgi:hypothetical protein
LAATSLTLILLDPDGEDAVELPDGLGIGDLATEAAVGTGLAEPNS